MDEVFVGIRAKQYYLYSAVGQASYVIDILIENRRDTNAAVWIFGNLMKGRCCALRRLVADKLKSYPAAHPDRSLKRIDTATRTINATIQVGVAGATIFVGNRHGRELVSTWAPFTTPVNMPLFFARGH
ncbi:MAG: DDE-type integrase/transposase/recombinase [Gammaproteobacteria bacterium]|nr:DDE-type integrase/transposase/recombinase [Gammaproteobacteria bacterium]